MNAEAPIDNAGAPRARRVAVLIFKAGISLSLLAILAHKVPLADAAHHLAMLSAGPAVTAALLLGVSLGLSAWRWHVVSSHHLPFPVCVQFTWVGHLYALVLPGALSSDLVKGAILANRTRDGNRMPLATSIILDRIAGLGMLLILGLLACLLRPDLIRVPAPVIVSAATGGSVALLAMPWLMRTCVNRFQRWQSFNHAVSFRRWTAVLGLSALIHAANINFYWACFLSVGGDQTWGSMGIYTSLLNLAVLLPVSIAGVGIREQLANWFLGEGSAISIAFGMLVLALFACHAVIGLVWQWRPLRVQTARH